MRTMRRIRGSGARRSPGSAVLMHTAHRSKRKASSRSLEAGARCMAYMEASIGGSRLPPSANQVESFHGVHGRPTRSPRRHPDELRRPLRPTRRCSSSHPVTHGLRVTVEGRFRIVSLAARLVEAKTQPDLGCLRLNEGPLVNDEAKVPRGAHATFSPTQSGPRRAPKSPVHAVVIGGYVARRRVP